MYQPVSNQGGSLPHVNSRFDLPGSSKEYITVTRSSCSLLGSRESYVWNDLLCVRKKNEPSVAVYHPRLSRCSHGRMPGMELLWRCAHGQERVPICCRWRADPWVVENGLWLPCVPAQLYQPVRVHDGKCTVADITCQSDAVWKLHQFNDHTATPLFSPPSLPKIKSKHLHPAMLYDFFFFYSSLTLQIYGLFEGNSEWLWLFISPKASPALRSLIRCFLCLAHSVNVNYCSAFSSFMLSYLKSITHWVDKLVK